MFGGNGRTQNKVVRGLIDLSSKCKSFTPEKYALRTYDFKIYFPIDGSKKFHKGFDKVMGRVRSTFDAKQI